MDANPQDARAPYYLGNLVFDWQPEEAIALWEKSTVLDPNFAIAWRNLAQAYLHRPGRTTDEANATAIAALEKAVALPDANPTHFAELDQLFQAAGVAVEKRLALLESHRALVVQKDEGLAALIALETFSGRADDAIALLKGRTFSIWEGGTRFNTGQAWTDAHLTRGLGHFAARRYKEALSDFGTALVFPANLRTSENIGDAARQSEIAYWIGCAHEALGDSEKARAAWTRAATRPAQPERRRGQGGREPALAANAARFHEAAALRKLGETSRADAIFRELVATANTALAPEPVQTVDPNNTNFTRRESQRTRLGSAHYIAGLGHAGLGEKEKARSEFNAALAAVPDHLGAKLALSQL